jgi:peptide/nickel transport system substrate-binding protein
LEDADNKEFDMVALAWVNTPGLDDMKQIWHSDASQEGGDNRVSFSNSECDKLIDEVRVTLDEAKRSEMYKRIQQIIYDEQPYIFLFVPNESIAIHNRFEGTETSPMRPGYTDGTFKLRK